MAEFKPNIYPVMYWGLLYGLVAGFVLLLIHFLSQYLTLLWFPVFLTGVVWGGYRNYQKQKRGAGVAVAGSVVEEFRSAASDIVQATREMIQAPEEEVAGESPFETTAEVGSEPPVPPTAPPVNQTEEQVTEGGSVNNQTTNQGGGPPPPPPVPPQQIGNS